MVEFKITDRSIKNRFNRDKPIEEHKIEGRRPLVESTPSDRFTVKHAIIVFRELGISVEKVKEYLEKLNNSDKRAIKKFVLTMNAINNTIKFFEGLGAKQEIIDNFKRDVLEILLTKGLHNASKYAISINRRYI